MRELSISRQSPHNSVSKFLNALYHFNTEFLAYDLNIAPLPVSFGTEHDGVSWLSCA